MNPGLVFFLGLMTLPVLAGIALLVMRTFNLAKNWYLRPIEMDRKTLAYRRSLIVGLTLEILDASHVRAVRLPFNRVFLIRSNPQREYDFISKDWVLIGGDFDNARSLIGKALDELGYELPEDDDE